jgi:hypothetical protein
MKKLEMGGSCAQLHREKKQLRSKLTIPPISIITGLFRGVAGKLSSSPESSERQHSN